MKINKHELERTGLEGNGFHGVCTHCGVSLETDIGWSSWDGLKCVDREIEMYQDIPKDVREYADWRGLSWDNRRKIFTKPFTNEEYTVDILNNIVTVLNNTIIADEI